MLISKKMTLRPLLESSNGVHLTAYIVNRGKHGNVKKQLRESIVQADEWLEPVMSFDERKKFLEPLESLLGDERIFKQIKGNIGLFRNQESFRVLNIPVDVEQSCHVATSFHVKPLLRWLQSDQEFLLLGIEPEIVHLYMGSQDSLKLVDSVFFMESSDDELAIEKDFRPNVLRNRKSKRTEFDWINDWISELTKGSKPKLFVAGEKSLVEKVSRSLKYKNTVRKPIAMTFDDRSLGEICSSVRKIMKAESRDMIEKALMEFRFADESNKTRKNIFQISKAVVQGRVRKLIVSHEFSIFGKVNKKSGALAIHPFELDHEDDDILDDLAQMVLSQGGEVVIASQREIPKGRPILAILDDENPELEKFEEFHRWEFGRERCG